MGSRVGPGRGVAANRAHAAGKAPTSPLVEPKAGLHYIDSDTPSILSFLSWVRERRWGHWETRPTR